MRIKRFDRVERSFHLVLILLVTFQAYTGSIGLFSGLAWGRILAWPFQGADSAMSFHRACGFSLLALIGAHFILAARAWRAGGRASLTGPDSILPGPADLGHFFWHIWWMAGLAGPVRQDRWAYWEKIAYWGVVFSLAVLGLSGLLLNDPLASSRLVSGQWINPARWIHRMQAGFLAGGIFVFHFYCVHWRAGVFPMDSSMFEPGMDIKRARREKSLWLKRLRAGGELKVLTARCGPAGFYSILWRTFSWGAAAIWAVLIIGGLAAASRLVPP